MTESRLGPITEWIDAVLSQMFDPNQMLGIVIHGSRAVSNKVDRMSDLDVVLIESAGLFTNDTVHFPVISVDILRGTPEQLRKGLKTFDPLNNNWLLNSLKFGMIHREGDRHASNLATEAAEVWENGPPPMSLEEYTASHFALNRMLSTARKRSARFAVCPDLSFAAQKLTNQVAIRAIYLYYRVRRIWTSGLTHLLERISTDEPTLYSLWTKYRDAASQRDRFEIAEELARMAFAELP
jgi:hypothetical protein